MGTGGVRRSLEAGKPNTRILLELQESFVVTARKKGEEIQSSFLLLYLLSTSS